MKTFLLMLVLSTDGGYHQYVIDHGLSYDDCVTAMQTNVNYICVGE